MTEEYSLRVVRVFVTDWARAIRFYTETLGIPTTTRSDEAGWAELATGQAALALERVDPADREGRASAGRFVGVSLRVADVEATYRRLSARGVTFLEPPERQPWGGILAHFRDPDGNVLTLLGAPEVAGG